MGSQLLSVERFRPKSQGARPPHTELSDVMRTRAEQYHSWVDAHGRRPSLEGDGEERSLAKWRQNAQRHRFADDLAQIAEPTFWFRAPSPLRENADDLAQIAEFGRYGFLDDDGTRVTCHECGKKFKSLAGHLKMHGMDADEYRWSHGLGWDAPLASLGTREKLVAAWTRNEDVHRAHGRHGNTPGRQSTAGRKTRPQVLHAMRAARDPRWNAMLAAIVVWRDEHGNLPRARKGTTAEQQLGTWLINQRGFHRRGELNPDRERTLDAQLPGWRTTTHKDQWKTHLLELVAFTATHERMPVETSSAAEESRLARWVTRQRAQAHTDPEGFATRKAMLDNAIPGWLPNTPHGTGSKRARLNQKLEYRARVDGFTSVRDWITSWNQQGLNLSETARAMGIARTTLPRVLADFHTDWAACTDPIQRNPIAEVAHRLVHGLPLPRPDSWSMRDRVIVNWLQTHPEARKRLFP